MEDDQRKPKKFRTPSRRKRMISCSQSGESSRQQQVPDEQDVTPSTRREQFQGFQRVQIPCRRYHNVDAPSLNFSPKKEDIFSNIQTWDRGPFFDRVHQWISKSPNNMQAVLEDLQELQLNRDSSLFLSPSSQHSSSPSPWRSGGVGSSSGSPPGASRSLEHSIETAKKNLFQDEEEREEEGARSFRPISPTAITPINQPLQINTSDVSEDSISNPQLTPSTSREFVSPSKQRMEADNDPLRFSPYVRPRPRKPLPGKTTRVMLSEDNLTFGYSSLFKQITIMSFFNPKQIMQYTREIVGGEGFIPISVILERPDLGMLRRQNISVEEVIETLERCPHIRLNNTRDKIRLRFNYGGQSSSSQ